MVMSSMMDETQAPAGELKPDDAIAPEAAATEAPAGDAPPAEVASSEPATGEQVEPAVGDDSVGGEVGSAETSNEPATPDIPAVAPEAPAPVRFSRRKQEEDDDDVYIPPVKPETMGKAEAGSGRPSLPAHMTEDDTPRDPSTVPLQWFVLKVQSNREKSIRDTLVRRIKREGYGDFFGEIVIPTEKVVETKGGKRKIREQKLFPGYMMIQVRLTDETWFLVRDTSGVGDFTGASGRPIPMAEHEIERMLGAEAAVGEEEKPHRPVVKFSIAVGDVVKVKEGAFESFEGAIDSMDETTGKVKVIIEIFGRPTEVELEHWQVEKA
jgi:transcriptional antiterminator NusG